MGCVCVWKNYHSNPVQPESFRIKGARILLGWLAVSENPAVLKFFHFRESCILPFFSERSSVQVGISFLEIVRLNSVIGLQFQQTKL